MTKKIVVSALIASSLVMAAEPNTLKDDALVTHTEFGYIETAGNTKTQTFNLDSKAKKGWGKHIFNLMFDGQYASDSSVETKNKFVTEATYDYEFTNRFAFNYLIGYKSDRFSGFAYQAYTGPGAKYKAIMTDEHKLTVDGNILYAQDSYEDIYVDGTGASINYPNSTANGTLQTPAHTDDYAAYRVKGVYVWQILKNLKFDQELSLRGSFKQSDSYFAYSKTGLSTKISSIFSAGVSYKVDYTNIPADSKEKTDTTLTLNLIMDY